MLHAATLGGQTMQHRVCNKSCTKCCIVWPGHQRQVISYNFYRLLLTNTSHSTSYILYFSSVSSLFNRQSFSLHCGVCISIFSSTFCEVSLFDANTIKSYKCLTPEGCSTDVFYETIFLECYHSRKAGKASK